MSSPFMPPQSTPRGPSSSSGGYDAQAHSPFAAAAPSAPAAGSPFGDSAARRAQPFDSSPLLASPQQATDNSGAACARPVSVRVAAFSLLAAGALSLVLAGFGVFAIWELRDSADDLLNLDPSGTAKLLGSGYADDAETSLTVILVAVGSLITIAYMLVARSVWKGSSWPRSVSAFLIVLSLPALFMGFVAIAIVAVGTAATIALWMPSARAYSADVGAARWVAKRR